MNASMYVRNMVNSSLVPMPYHHTTLKNWESGLGMRVDSTSTLTTYHACSGQMTL